MPQWPCEVCRWLNEENADSCTQCDRSTREGDPGMTEGESSSEDEQPETPAKDEIDQEYELPDEEGGEEDNEENNAEYDRESGAEER
ncbi:hypothetical protein AA0113_g6757 [Alternaria arborescens]|uniref:RanBP2-type domain-containing protein n=1 Tax=Alternaria arborescens TaxID=156630 RepID=A0A4V1X522_9PLEO|nr:hypothetical protein AA0111_g1307 [Alternaria arborescens]RYO41199.1 hypothetical protein AA0111_g1307 [Alternaria arborescens]RYO61478.1 hypothetical protein AA0113_g6757 [Alternaria arborescens]